LQTFLFPYRHLVMPRLRKRYGDIVAIELLGRPSVLLYTPELNKIVFSGSPEVFHAGEENFNHDHNIGTVVRTANAFAAAAVHIVGRRRWNRRGAMVTDRY